MTNEEFFALRQRHKEFAATDLGRLFLDFESKLSRAWQLDTQAGCLDNVSDKRLREAWDASSRARAALMEKLMSMPQ